MNELIFNQTDILGSVPTLLAAIGIALLSGIIAAVVYRLGTDKPSKYMIISAVVIPSIVAAVIMVVNGSIGAGIAAAGAFSLVRFRSIPGSSRDICVLFFGMASGLITGMGYLGFGIMFSLIIGIVIIVGERLMKATAGGDARQLKIVIPEDMEYNGAFDDVFEEFTASCKAQRVRTIRMGTMYELTYHVQLKKGVCEKEMLDKLRCRNGNLTVSLGLIPDSKEEL